MDGEDVAKLPRRVASSVAMQPVRVSRKTKRRILAELDRLNRKDFGRHVTADEIVALAVSLLGPEHCLKLQEATLSNADRLEQRYRAYVKEHGPTTKDEFLGKLLAGTANPQAPITAPEEAKFAEK
jgi:hypothetical protein